MHSRLSVLTFFALLLAACGPSDKTAADTDPTDGDLTVFVYEAVGEKPVPLEGAVVGLSQDGVVSTLESDAEGRATFAIDPEGGPIITSAYLTGYVASSVVGYEYDSKTTEPDGTLPLALQAQAAPSDYIQVTGQFERPDPDLVQVVFSGSSGPDVQNLGARFLVPAQRGEPFVLTAYLQVWGPRPTPSDGMQWPLVSFRTLEHKGSANDIDVTRSVWTEHDIAEHTLRVKRPSSPALLADDWSPIGVRATGTDGGEVVVVGDATALEPWLGRTSYAVTMSGRADLMDSTDLRVATTLYAANDQRYSTIHSQGALPSSIDGPFLAPPEVTTAAPRLDQPFAWNPGDASVWTFLRAGVDSTLWSVAVLPGISSVDMPALLATLPTAPLRGRDLTAWLLTCESEEGSSACLRTAGSATFAINAGAKK